MVILRSGPEWQMPYDKDTIAYIKAFHEIASEHGSEAQWLPVTGTLISTNDSESAQHFPYDLWREQAITKAKKK